MHLTYPYRRAALQKWKQKRGSSATYGKLINVFEQAGYQGYAEMVRGKLSNVKNSVTMHASLPQPPQLLPVFPEQEIISSSTILSSTTAVLIIEEEYQGIYD